MEEQPGGGIDVDAIGVLLIVGIVLALALSIGGDV